MEDQEIANQFANFFFRTFEKEPKEVGLADDVSVFLRALANFTALCDYLL